MKWMIALTMLAGCASAPVPATGSLDGRWTVDLSTEPGQPYTKLMELKLAADGTVVGSFYDSDILAGRWKTSRSYLRKLPHN